MKHLTTQEVDGLWQAIVNANHVGDGVFDAAVSALMPLYRQGLATDTPMAVYGTLNAMNQEERLVDGTVPLEAVLSRLRLLTTNAKLSGRAAGLLAKVEGQTGIGGNPGAYAGGTAGQEEAYTGDDDDTLPYAFLEDGFHAGQGVVKLVVPRFEGGQPAEGPMGPRRFNGTGWLVAPDMVLTNFHVICARESGEAEPSDTDLTLQVQHTKALFDYDEDGATGIEIPVLALVARGTRGGEQDYAILRIDPTSVPAGRNPLGVRCQPPSVPKSGFPVNIIQHPAGLPKRIALRANLLKTATTQRLEYFGDTLGGSSGSPLCNDRWEVIGIHRASGPCSGVLVKGRFASAFNLGIPISAIRADLEAKHPQLLASLGWG
jgi:endonuclease G, mitochondrial